MGTTAYFIQGSKADERKGRDFQRSHIWGTDLKTEARFYNPKDARVVFLGDVDYYLEEHEILSVADHSLLISTFQPGAAAAVEGDYCFTFHSENEVEYRVNGAATFRHLVWNYSGDTVCIEDRGWLLTERSYYNLDRKQVDQHHQLILLSPIAKIVVPTFLAYWAPTAERLKRLQVAKGDFARVEVFTSDGPMISTALLGQFASATVTAEIDGTIANQAALSKNEISISSVRSLSAELSTSDASILCRYHRQKWSYTPDSVVSVELGVHTYQYGGKDYEVDAKPLMSSFMSPLIDVAHTPLNTYSNEEAAVKYRIEKVATNPPTNDFIESCIKDFLIALVPVSGKGFPADHDLVYEKQSRPTQRRIVHDAVNRGDILIEEVIPNFLKAEGYESAKDPRIISTLEGKTKVEYSTFTYAVTDFIKECEWYGFGKKNVDLAQRVADICSMSQNVSETDLARFDGRHSAILVGLERAFMLRFFHPQFHVKLLELMEKLVNRRARMRLGKKYQSGFARLSGSPDTAVFNSLDNAFMGYLGLRKTRDISGVFLSHKEAWEQLQLKGIFAGDDGLLGDVDPVAFQEACDSVGQVLELTVRRRGDIVTFLARAYGPDVFYNDPNSCCDIRRQLGKLHITSGLPESVPASQKLAEKLMGYYLTDRHTPIIGDIVSVCLPVLRPNFREEAQLGFKGALGVASYHARDKMFEQYPNDYADWMYTFVEQQMPGFNLEMFFQWKELVEKTKDVNLMLNMPLCFDPEDRWQQVVKETLHVDGWPIEPKVTVLDSPVQVVSIPEKEKQEIEPVPFVHLPVSVSREMLADALKGVSFGRGKTRRPAAILCIDAAGENLDSLQSYIDDNIALLKRVRSWVASNLWGYGQAPVEIFDVIQCPVETLMQQQQTKSKKPKKAKPASTGAQTKTSSGSRPAKSQRSLDLGFAWDGYGVKASGSLKSRNNNTPNVGSFVTKSETIGTLVSPAPGQVGISVVHVFQPGLATQFPWLSTQASGYQRYRVHGARYTFVPSVGQYAVGGQMGRVALFFDYDVAASVPTNVDGLVNGKPSIFDKPSTAMTLELNPAFMQDAVKRGRLVRNSDLSSSLARRDFDAGKLVVGMDGFGASGPIGHVTVEYTVELLVPQPAPTVGELEISSMIDSFTITWTNLTFALVASGVGRYLGDASGAWAITPGNAGNVTLSGTTFSLSPGRYLVTWRMQCGDPTGGSTFQKVKTWMTFGSGGQTNPVGTTTVGGSAGANAIQASDCPWMVIAEGGETAQMLLDCSYTLLGVSPNVCQIVLTFMATS
jgi:hypothetical protein